MAIEKSKTAKKILIGSFLNKSAIADYLANDENDVLVHCAGWKGKFNLEDTLYAGALVDCLQTYFAPACDAPLGAQSLYRQAKTDLYQFLSKSSHFERLKRLNIEKDIVYCLKEDQMDVIPIFNGNMIVKAI